MAPTVVCPGCHAPLPLAVPARAGADLACPRCGASVPLPSAGETVARRPDTQVSDNPALAIDQPTPTLLGPYRVLGLLGAGGMGRVYRAEEPSLKRQVALKVMRPELASDPAAKARFVREAQAQAKVEHDHVVAIHRVGADAGVPFIAMPLLKGRTLADALAAEPRLPPGEVIRVGREVAEGLAAAHDHGLIHRDIKPANVWLEGPRRRVKILDFGLARVGAAGGETPADGPIGTTILGAVVGTPRYMSPEQARGGPVDVRTDLFSLGVLLYELATGSPPFTGRTTPELLREVIGSDPPPAGVVNPGLPPALSDLISRLLAKAPADRPPSAAVVADELGRLATAAPADDPWQQLGDDPAPPPPRPPAARWVRPVSLTALAAGVLAVFLGVVAVVQLLTPPAVLTVEGEEVELVVRRDGAEVARTRERAIRLPRADGYTVEPADPTSPLKVDPARVSLAGGRSTVTVFKVRSPTVRASPPSPAPVPVPTPDPPQREPAVAPPAPVPPAPVTPSPPVPPRPKVVRLPDQATVPGPVRVARGVDADGLKTWADTLGKGHLPTSINLRPRSNPPRYDAVAVPNTGELEWELTTQPRTSNAPTIHAGRVLNGFRPHIRLVRPAGGELSDLLVWAKTHTPVTGNWGYHLEPDRDGLDRKLRTVRVAGGIPTSVQPFPNGKGEGYALTVADWGGRDWEYAGELTRADLTRRTDEFRAKGWYPRSIAAHDPATPVRFAVVFAPTPPGVGWEFAQRIPERGFDTAAAALAAVGYRPHTIASVVEAGTTYYAVVWVRPPTPE